MPLFHDVRTRSGGPKRNGESTFEFHARQSQPYWIAIRGVMEAWFSSYPDPAKARLAGNIRSGDDHAFLGAWWELYLHALFVRLGADCTVEDHRDGADLCARWPNGELWIEATATAAAGRAEPRFPFDERLAQIVEGLVLPCDVRVGLSRSGDQPPVRLARRRLQEAVDAWEVRPGHHISQLDPTSVSVGEWTVEIAPAGWVPRPGTRRVALPFGGGFEDRTTEVALRRLRSKAKQSRNVPGHRLLALLTCTGFHDDRRLATALARPHDSPPRTTLWNHEREPRSRGVVGVLHADGLQPHSVGAILPTLWQNPWVGTSLPAALPFRTQNPVAGRGRAATDTAHAVLGLPETWPGERFAPE